MFASSRKTEELLFRAIIYQAILILLFVLSATAQDMETKYDAYFKPYVETGNFNGTVLVAKDGKIVFCKGYGFASYELKVPDSAETKFPLGSIGKQLTAVSILQLEERGRLKLDDKIKKYIPEYHYGDQITIENLLTHMSGIPEYEELLRSNSRVGESKPVSIEQGIKLLGKQKLEFKPGSEYRYSNTGYWLLSLIMEKITGEPFDRYLKKNIFEPLGMSDTVVDLGQIIENRAIGYIMTHKGLIKSYYFEIPRTGSIFTTVGDLYKFNSGLLQGKLLKPSTVEQMTTLHNKFYGYAWFVDETPGNRKIWHGGVTPGYRATVYDNLDKGLTLIVFSNIYNTPINKIRDDVAAIAEGGKYVIPDARKTVAVDADIMKQYTGSYKDSEGYIANIIKGDDGLYLEISHVDRNRAASIHSQMTLYPRAKNIFFPMEMNADLIFHAEGDKKAKSFDFVIDGQLTRMNRFNEHPILPSGPPTRQEDREDFR